MVRWTNLYDPPPELWVLGDLISGPLSGSVEGQGRFGRGVDDKLVTIKSKRGFRFFSHNDYWTNPDPTGDSTPEYLDTFRKAVDLFRPPA